nr:MAG TPA: hypothetical protein [Caudoviricetes sp.]
MPPSPLQQAAGALCVLGRGGICLSARKPYQKWVWQRNAQIGEMGSILPNQIETLSAHIGKFDTGGLFF